MRQAAFGAAYRMVGSVGEAEDLVQEAFLRLHRERAAGARIDSAEGFLVTVVTRLGIDHLRSARSRRETVVGEWLPEPILTAEEDDPGRHAEIAESLSMALLVVLERLSPEQRAVFLLRDVFDYPYDRIAAVLGKSPAAVRQLATRARRQVEEGTPRFETSREQRRLLANRFFDAIEEGDLAGLEALLAEDAVVRSEGGSGRGGRAARGRVRCLQAMRAGLARLQRMGTTLRRTEVNGEPGLLVVDRDERLVGVVTVDVAGGCVQAVTSIFNPDKLRHLGPVADRDALLRAARDRTRRPS
ncbi:MAG: RNA polymerase sigma factor SigJ [Solirubrobacteraceae bacterium]|nr:RNA polymerase sigma factor SigJ [Solirubrobacteraceae bacterium]